MRMARKLTILVLILFPLLIMRMALITKSWIIGLLAFVSVLFIATLLARSPRSQSLWAALLTSVCVIPLNLQLIISVMPIIQLFFGGHGEQEILSTIGSFFAGLSIYLMMLTIEVIVACWALFSLNLKAGRKKT